MAPTRSLRAEWALREVGADYEFITVRLSAGEQLKPEFLRLNPHQAGTLISLARHSALARYVIINLGIQNSLLFALRPFGGNGTPVEDRHEVASNFCAPSRCCACANLGADRRPRPASCRSSWRRF